MNINDISEKTAKKILDGLAKSKGFDYFSKSTSSIRDFYHSCVDMVFVVLANTSLQYRRAAIFVSPDDDNSVALRTVIAPKSFCKILAKMLDLSRCGKTMIFRNWLIEDKRLCEGVFLPAYSSLESILMSLDLQDLHVDVKDDEDKK